MEIDAAAKIAVTLSAQQWGVLLGVLGDAPYRVVAPLIGEITQQAERSAGAVGRLNGEAHADERLRP